jgi:filamentous hemagglutinin family protein
MIKTKFWRLILTLSGLIFSTENSIAQTYQPSNRTPLPDKTLGTQVSGNGNNFNITGGLNRGQTLLHSFTDFSIPTGGAANFNNPAGIRDIITRVTGRGFSDLNGTLNSNGANFLLINPNGVVFGPNARLNVGKAFAASTANGVDLVDGQGGRYTFGTNPNGDAPLLKINPNVFFNPSQLNMGASVPGNSAIINYGTLQNKTNNPGQYIGLIGGGVGLSGGKIIAPGGKVELGGLNQAGGIGFSFDKGVQFPTNIERGDVLLVERGILPSIINVESAGGGGSVGIFAKDITLQGAETKVRGGIAAGVVSPNAKAGDIKFDATGNVALSTGDIFNQVAPGGVGKGGNIEINTRNLFLTNGAQLGASTFGQGDAGNVKITATGDIFVDGGQGIFRSGALSTVESGGVGKGGSIDITAQNLSLTNTGQLITVTRGQGDAGNVTVKVSEAIDIAGFKNGLGSGIFSYVDPGVVGNGGNINVSAGSFSLRDGTKLEASTSGRGNAGNIDITTTGNLTISGTNDSVLIQQSDGVALSKINSSTFGQGDAGKITINTAGKLSVLNKGGIFSTIDATGVGNSNGIKIDAGELEIANRSSIQTTTAQAKLVNGKGGNAGNIDIKTKGNLTISGTKDSTLLQQPDGVALSSINSSTFGQGDAGKITIGTAGKLSVLDKGGIFSEIGATGVGNNNGIKIDAGELEIANRSSIKTTTFQSQQVKDTGNAGNIDIKTKGNLTISGKDSTLIQQADAADLSNITSSTEGQGDAGKITIDTGSKLSVLNKSGIFSTIEATGVGNSNGIKIDAGELEIANRSSIETTTAQSQQVKDKGNAGDIDITTNGNLTIIGTNNSSAPGSSGISSSTSGKGDAGKITINTQGHKLFLSSGGILSAIAPLGQGNSKGISINSGDLNLTNGSFIATANLYSQGDAGNITIISKGDIDLNSSGITSANAGRGQAGNISISSDKLNLNKSSVFTNGFSASGGDLNFDISDQLLLRNNSFITTSSDSSGKNGNGGNITINSPLIIATPGDNDIKANAFQGKGGRVNIISQGLFGIKYRPNAAEASGFTNDITASSTFGQSGVVDIKTPGVDPGKDSTTLPNVPTDASNQISQACSASNRQNKFTVAGRGGLPPNANDPLNTDVVWQDARATSSQPAASSTTTNPVKLPPPAVGWVFDGKGKVKLIAAGAEGQPTGTNVTCPNAKTRS